MKEWTLGEWIDYYEFYLYRDPYTGAFKKTRTLGRIATPKPLGGEPMYYGPERRKQLVADRRIQCQPDRYSCCDRRGSRTRRFRNVRSMDRRSGDRRVSERQFGVLRRGASYFGSWDRRGPERRGPERRGGGR